MITINIKLLKLLKFLDKTLMEVVFGNSAFTLQRQTPTRWSFSKDDRFKSPKNIHNSDLICPPSTLSPRSTSIGFGSRWELKNPNGKDCPPPGSYDLPTSINKALVPKIVKPSMLPLIENRYVSPGPGAYNPQNTGRNSPRYTMRERRIIKKINRNKGSSNTIRLFRKKWHFDKI